jgi:SMI1/KNR4 family protein SUKH-1
MASEEDRVVRVLAQLEGAVRGGHVVDPTLRARIVEAHRDGGMEDDATVVVVLRGAASPSRMEPLDALCRARFQAPLPAGLRACLARHDGIWAGDAGPDASVEELHDEHHEAGLFPAARIDGHLRQVLSSEIGAGGSRDHHWPVLPFFDVPDQGFHALDFSRRGADGGVPVVAYYFDEQDGDRTDHCQVIADGFATWLEGWVGSGFDTFWFERRGR